MAIKVVGKICTYKSLNTHGYGSFSMLLFNVASFRDILFHECYDTKIRTLVLVNYFKTLGGDNS